MITLVLSLTESVLQMLWHDPCSSDLIVVRFRAGGRRLRTRTRKLVNGRIIVVGRCGPAVRTSPNPDATC